MYNNPYKAPYPKFNGKREHCFTAITACDTSSVISLLPLSSDVHCGLTLEDVVGAAEGPADLVAVDLLEEPGARFNRQFRDVPKPVGVSCLEFYR